jgi:hypothetical protein
MRKSAGKIEREWADKLGRRRVEDLRQAIRDLDGLKNRPIS